MHKAAATNSRMCMRARASSYATLRGRLVSSVSVHLVPEQERRRVLRTQCARVPSGEQVKWVIQMATDDVQKFEGEWEEGLKQVLHCVYMCASCTLYYIILHYTIVLYYTKLYHIIILYYMT
jgi:hypothetical protein